MRYAIVIEKGPTSYGAYVPDLPGCVAVAKTAAGVKKLIAEAVPLHLEGLREDGLPIPDPETECEYVEVRPRRVAQPPNKSLPQTRRTRQFFTGAGKTATSWPDGIGTFTVTGKTNGIATHPGSGPISTICLLTTAVRPPPQAPQQMRKMSRVRVSSND